MPDPLPANASPAPCIFRRGPAQLEPPDLRDEAPMPWPGGRGRERLAFRLPTDASLSLSVTCGVC